MATGEQDWVAVAGHPHTPENLLLVLARTGLPEVHRALANRAYVPGEVRMLLTERATGEPAPHRDLSVDEMWRLLAPLITPFDVHHISAIEAGDRYHHRVEMIAPVTDPRHVRWAGLAENLATPDEILRLLAATDIPVVLLTVAHREDFSPAVAELLADHWRTTGVDLLYTPACNGNLPEHLLRELAAADDEARANAAGAPNLPPELLPVLLDDPSPKVRVVATGRDDLSLAQLTRLARDPDVEVRRCLGYRCRDLPMNVVEILAADPSPKVRAEVIDVVGANWVPVFAKDPDPNVRALVARDRVSSMLLIDELVRDEHPAVRLGVCRSRYLKPRHLALLADDPDEAVRKNVEWRLYGPKPRPAQVARPLSEEEQERFAAGNARLARIHEAYTTHTAPDVLTGYAVGDDELAAQAACANESLPVATMWRLVAPLSGA